MISEEKMRINRASNEKTIDLVSRYDRIYGSDDGKWPDDVKQRYNEEYNEIVAEHSRMLKVAGIAKVVEAMNGLIEVEYPGEWKAAEKEYQEAMIASGHDPRRIDLAEDIVKDAKPWDKPRPANEASLDQWVSA